MTTVKVNQRADCGSRDQTNAVKVGIKQSTASHAELLTILRPENQGKGVVNEDFLQKSIEEAVETSNIRGLGAGKNASASRSAPPPPS